MIIENPPKAVSALAIMIFWPTGISEAAARLQPDVISSMPVVSDKLAASETPATLNGSARIESNPILSSSLHISMNSMI